MEKKDGGSAFPTAYVDNAPSFDLGMSLRDWFAGQAIAGCAEEVSDYTLSAYARDAYLLADAMLKAREAKP